MRALPALLLTPLLLAATPAPAVLTSKPLTLPGASGALMLDYIAFERGAGRVWVPAAGTGSIDVYEVATGKMTRIDGFATAEREMHGQKRVLGPTAVTIGEDTAYVGNRATSEVCAVSLKTLTRGACVHLASSPDGLQYVAATRQVWVTTPNDHSITILDAALKPVGRVPIDGEPEGYAVDNERGLFFTNVEDKDRTLVLDARTHEVKASWKPACGDAGPRGISFDAVRQLVFVACTNSIVVLNPAKDGAVLARRETGGGIDNIDYLPSSHLLYVASGKDAKLRVFRVEGEGALTLIQEGPTAEGCRTVVSDDGGVAYVADPRGGGIRILRP